MATDEPITFKSKAQIEAEDASQLVWVCTRCSCMSFEIRANGDCICCNCSQVSEGPEDGAWFDKHLRDVKPSEETILVPDALNTVVHLNEYPSIATRRFIASLDAQEVNCIIAIMDSGMVRTFGVGFENLTDEQLEWRGRKLVEGMNILMNGGLEDDAGTDSKA